MKKLSEIEDEVLLCVMQRGYDDIIMEKKDFMQSGYYPQKGEIDVAIAEELCACFNLKQALGCLDDDMHDGWLEDALNTIPKEAVKRIESEINEYLQKVPSYYAGEKISWLD